MLSQGPDDSAWFEHRMLAEEMGVPLVRSTELFVEDARVYRLRDGKRYPVDVIYLRMGEDSLVHSPGADGMPLGPSLVAALHADTVVLANALGNGIGDDKAVYAYVPRLIEYYLGEKPLLADVPTYLCGIPEQRAEVLGRLDELVCKPVDGYGGDRIVIGPHASAGGARRGPPADPRRAAPLGGPGGGARCPPTRSSTATQLAPRHVDLRAFVFTGARVGGRAGRADPGRAGRQHDRQLVPGRRLQGHLAARVSAVATAIRQRTARRFGAMCGIAGELRYDGRRGGRRRGSPDAAVPGVARARTARASGRTGRSRSATAA